MLFTIASCLAAETHVVNPADLHRETLAAAAARQRNVQSVTNLLSSPAARKALALAGTDEGKVKSAVSALSDEELARLASLADKTQRDFAAGRISDRDLLWILVIIAGVILIILAAD
ncbi:MAG: hypothetical protein ACE15B_03280 [Bryobacteraceae bacterium]